jgi:hypothetical protein
MQQPMLGAPVVGDEKGDEPTNERGDVPEVQNDAVRGCKICADPEVYLIDGKMDKVRATCRSLGNTGNQRRQ